VVCCRFLGLDKNKFLRQNKNLFPNKYVLQVLESLAGMDFTSEEEYRSSFAPEFETEEKE